MSERHAVDTAIEVETPTPAYLHRIRWFLWAARNDLVGWRDPKGFARGTLRADILQRDEHRCQRCGSHEGPFEIDHAYPWRGAVRPRRRTVKRCAEICNLSKRDTSGCYLACGPRYAPRALADLNAHSRSRNRDRETVDRTGEKGDSRSRCSARTKRESRSAASCCGRGGRRAWSCRCWRDPCRP